MGHVGHGSTVRWVTWVMGHERWPISISVYNILFCISKLRRRSADSHLWCSVFNIVKQFFRKHVLIVHPTFDTSSTSFCEVQCGGPCWLSSVAASPILTARLPSFISVLWLGIKCLVVFKHNSPDVIIKTVNVWRVWWSFVFANKFTAVGGNPVLSQLCRVSCQMKPDGRRDLHSSISLGDRVQIKV